MKPFVINRYGRIVFPFNFFPELDFSAFQTLEQFAAVIKRDFEEKAPNETDILQRVESQAYKARFEILRDLALHLFWVNRYAMTMYEKRPTRWRDVARHRDDIFLPVFEPRDGSETTAAIEGRYRSLPATWDEGTEDKICRVLLDILRHKKWAGAELPAIKPTVGEILANPKNLTFHLLAYDPDYPGYGYDDIIEFNHRVPELEALMRQTMVLHNQYRWDRSKLRLTEVGRLHDDDYVVVFHPRSDDVLHFIRRVKGMHRVPRRKPVPAESRRPVLPYPPLQVRERFKVMPKLEAVAVYKGERPCTNDDLIRNAAYCWSPMTAAEILRKTGIEERLYTELDLDHMALLAAQRALEKSRHRPEEIGAVIFCSCTSVKMMPSLATWLSGQLGIFQTHVSCDIVAACAGPALRPERGGAPAPGGGAPHPRGVRREVLRQDRHGAHVPHDLRRRRGRPRDRARAGGGRPRRRGAADVRERPHVGSGLDHLAQSRVRQQHHGVRAGGARPRQALSRPDAGRAARPASSGRDGPAARSWTRWTSSSPTRRTRPWW